MKSILAKQAPQRSPWLKTRARQEMQTGGKTRSAKRPSMGRNAPALAQLPKGAADIAWPSCPSPMTPIISRNGAWLKARSLARG